jgi:hypothetical protein
MKMEQIMERMLAEMKGSHEEIMTKLGAKTRA